MSEKYPQLKLTPKQARAWNATRTAFLWSAPSFADIWYALMVDEQGETAHFTDKFPTAATNGKTLFLNPVDFLDNPARTLDHQGVHLGA